MSNVVIIQGDSLESYYELTIEYLHAKYHSYPSVFNGSSPLTHKDQYALQHESLASEFAQEGQMHVGIPVGKVVF